MKLRRLRKGFTLVELVVVIAIIAILAGVSVAVYVSVTNNAKKSADSQVVAQLNTKLRADGLLEGKNKTAMEAFEDADEIGFNLAKMTPQYGDHYVWDEKNDLFAVMKGDEVVYEDATTKLVGKDEEWKRWIFTSKPEESEKRSQFFIGESWNALTVHSGFDAGLGKVEQLNYINKAGDPDETVTPKDVVIRTNSFETKLSINAPLDTVNHYAEVFAVDIESVGLNDCYHEYGRVASRILIEEGKLAIEEGGEATTIIVDNTDPEKVELEIKEGSSVGTLADLNDIVPDDISEKFNYVVDSNNTDDSIETIASSKGYIETNGKRKYYDDLQTAFNEGEGKTIVLTTDDFYNNVSIAKFKVTNTTTLDLNGKILTARLTNNMNVSLIKIAGGNLTIKDSTAPQHSYGTGALIAEPAVYSDGWTVAVRVIAVERESTVEGTKSYLTIDSGKIIMKGAEGISNAANPYAIDIVTNNYKDCDMVVTINGGYLESKSESGMAVRLNGNAMESSVNIVVNGGEFVGDGRAIWLQQGQSHKEKNGVATSGFSKVNCTITAGSFKADRALAIADFNTNTTFNYEVKNIVVSISGGTFDSALSALGTSYIQSPSSDVVYLDGTSGWANQTEQHILITDTRK